MKRFKFAATTWGMPGEGLYAVQTAKKAGLDGIQLELGSYENGYPLAQREIYERFLDDSQQHGIEFPSLVLNDLGTHGFVNGRQTDEGKIAYEMLEIGVELASKMGIPMIMIPCFFENFITEEEHFANTADALRYCCELAEKHQILVGSETVLDGDSHIKIIDAADKPNLGIFFDTMNYKHFSKLDQMTVLKTVYPKMVPQLHVKDGINDLSGSLIGEGTMDFYQQAEWIDQSDFSGWIILENYYSHLPLRKDSHTNQLDLLKKDVATLQQVFSDKI